MPQTTAKAENAIPDWFPCGILLWKLKSWFRKLDITAARAGPANNKTSQRSSRPTVLSLSGLISVPGLCSTDHIKAS